MDFKSNIPSFCFSQRCFINNANPFYPQPKNDSTKSPRTSHPRRSCVWNIFAKVVEWRKLDSLADAERLRGQHVWRDEVIAERFDWGKSKNIFAMAVRVFRLPKSIELPNLPSYGGCKSWITLEQEIETNNATPVLDDKAFADKLVRFQESLKSKKRSIE